MKVYVYLFYLLTIAEILFTVIYYFITKRFDNIVVLGLIIYAGAMIITFITFKVEKYFDTRKQLIDSLPQHDTE